MSGSLQPMAVGRGSLDDHAAAAGAEAVERVRASAARLQGVRVVHVTVAGSGGRAPELLAAALPLAADAGLAPSWRVLFGPGAQATVAGQLHDGLQGAETAIDDASWEAYLDACGTAVAGLPDHDLLVLHEPGALGLAAAAPGAVAWRCHVDGSNPDGPAWERASQLAASCDGLLAPEVAFLPSDLEAGRVHSAPPGIDPLAPRNLELAPRLAGRVLRPLGVDLDRPFVLMLGRLDRWKDPHGVIEAHALAAAEVPGLQLVLGGALEGDDPAAWAALAEMTDYAEGHGDVLLLTSYGALGDLELCALQRLARVSVHRALREGFGLGASEALWKGTPVVGRPDGGLLLQVAHGVTGFLAEDVEGMAACIVELVRDPGLALELGRAGRDRVREGFLIVHSVAAELDALGTVLRA